MELAQLEQFVAVAQAGSLAAASQEVHVSSPALSVAVRRLEEELGLPLFERTGNRMWLNEHGHAICELAQATLDQADILRRSAARMANADHRLHGAFCDPGPRWYCVSRLAQAHPELKVEAESLDASAMNAGALLEHGEYDFVVTDNPVHSPGVACTPLLDDHMLLSVHRDAPLVLQGEVSLRDLESCVLLHFWVGGALDKRTERFLNELGGFMLDKQHDYILFMQRLRSSEQIATSSVLGESLRDHISDRAIVHVTDPEVAITYHLAYLERNKTRLRPLLEWAAANLGLKCVLFS